MTYLQAFVIALVQGVTELFPVSSLGHSVLLPAWIGGSWQVNGITTMRTGLPVSVSCGCDPRRVGQATSRADIVGGNPLRPATQFGCPGGVRQEARHDDGSRARFRRQSPDPVRLELYILML